jgi:putative peptidoglycan lipid II flippase
MSGKLSRNVTTVGAATLISRALGFVRDMMIAALFGAGARADAFFVAFQLVNLVRRLLAEGALNSSLVPLYLRKREESGKAAAAAFIGNILGTLTFVLAVLAGLMALAMPVVIALLAPGFAEGDERLTHSVEFARLMTPYVVLAGPLAVMMGLLNATHRFAAAACAAIVFNIALIIALAVILWHGDDSAAGRIFAGCVGLAGLAQLLLVAGAASLGTERVRVGLSVDPEMRRFAALAVPGMLSYGIPQLTVIGAIMVASAAPSAISWIYYANRLVELPLGVVGVAIGTAFVPAFTEAVRSGDGAEICEAESRGLELALGLALPAALGLATLADPIIRILFERGAFTAVDTTATAAALTAFAIGIPGHVLVKALSAVFFAREDTATPLRAALIGFVVAIAGSLGFMPLFGHVGIAAAVAFSGWVSAAILAVAVSRKIGFMVDHTARHRLPRIVAAALAMAVAVIAARIALPPLGLGSLVVLIAAAAGLYGTLLGLLKVLWLRR